MAKLIIKYWPEIPDNMISDKACEAWLSYKSLLNEPSVLRLTLKKKWFDMIASGEKKEEYRELKLYWADRLMNGWPSTYGYIETLNPDFKDFQYVELRNGYAKSAPAMILECKGIKIGKARPEWSEGFTGDCFIISLGNIMSITAQKKTKDDLKNGEYEI